MSEGAAEGVLYLDHAATSFPKAPGVAEQVRRHLLHDAGNPGRGGHRLAVAAARVLEEAREQVAELLGGDPERTLLGPGATHWLNVLLRAMVPAGGRVVTSSLEHNAVMRPLRLLQRERNVELVVVRGDEQTGVPGAEELRREVRAASTSLVVLTHASNVSGAVLPVAQLAAAVAPVPVVVDAAQSAGSVPLSFEDLGAAALVCSGHKGLLGPPGTGVLLLARDVEPTPLLAGGTGSFSESDEMPALLPDRLEVGTPNTPGFAGLAAACRWISSAGGVESLQRRTSALLHEARSRLAAIDGVRLHGLAAGGEAPRLGLLSCTVRGLDNGELATWLDRERGIMVRAGLHCAPAAHRRLGTFPHGTLRLSFGPFLPPEAPQRLEAALRLAATEGIS